MNDKPLKRPRDPAQLAKLMIDIASGELEDREAESPSDKDPAAVSLGRRGGLKGGVARAAKMAPERRATTIEEYATPSSGVCYPQCRSAGEHQSAPIVS
jgi:hypothetical protein